MPVTERVSGLTPYQAALALVLASCSSASGNGGVNRAYANTAGANTQSGGTQSGGVSGAYANTAGANTQSGGTQNGGAASGGGGAQAQGGSSAGANTAGAATQSGGAHSGGGTSGSGGAQAGRAGESGTGTSAGAAGSDGAALSVGTIVPLYTDPGDPSWAALITAKTAHPAVKVVAIVNPDSGPGAALDSSYTSGITRLVAAGITPIGYVSTSYAARGEPAVKADIDHWHTFYPSLQGIFFDEQSDQAGDAPFYRSVSAYAKGLGLAFTVGNPGTAVPASYAGAVDVMLIYESKGLPALGSLTGYASSRAEYGIIPYGAALDTTFVKAAKAKVQYIYATSDDLPNPWDSLPPYFGDMLTALEP